MDWVSRKGITGEFEPCAKFLEQEKCSSKHVISQFVSDDEVPLYLVLNLDQT